MEPTIPADLDGGEGAARLEGYAALVFCTDAGTPLGESRVRKAVRQALKLAKLPSFRFYDRHTYARLLLANTRRSPTLRALDAKSGTPAPPKCPI